MTWKSLSRAAALASVTLLLVAASPAAAAPLRERAAAGFFEPLIAALRHGLAQLRGEPAQKICPPAGALAGTCGGSPITNSEPPCEECGEAGPLLDPHG